MDKYLELLKTKGVTLIVSILTIADLFYVWSIDLEKAGTFKVMVLCLGLAIGVVYLIEKFVFTGWSLKDEIQKGNVGGPIVFLGICILVAAILSKLLPSL